MKKKNNYQSLISKDSITPAEATAISLIREIPNKQRKKCYKKVKHVLSEDVRTYIETRLL